MLALPLNQVGIPQGGLRNPAASAGFERENRIENHKVYRIDQVGPVAL